MGLKIAIIGGGIGGLTAAVALARRGVAAEVYEQAPVLAEVGAGVGLWPNAMTALEQVGLAGKVAQLAVKVARQGLKRPDGTWLTCIPAELMAQAGVPGSSWFTEPSCSSSWPQSSTPRSSTSVPAVPVSMTAARA
jgi:2-polyprenyl-6-methoxyphenol hydroxylase-like FAD-dependent oxidoreductase